MGTTDFDQKVEAAQTALLARHAPGTRVRRVAWSHGKTQLLDLGDGAPLLLVHGGVGDVFQWVPIMPALARHHRVFAVDRPGHGLADPFDYRGVNLLDHARRFLSDVLDALELRAVDLVANSMGGLWSVAFATSAPDRVRRLVLVGAPAGMKRAVPLQLRVLGLPLIGQPLGRVLMSNPTRDSTRKFWGQILVAHPEHLDDVLLDAVNASQQRNIASHLSLVQCALDAGGLRRGLIIGDRWQALKVPTVFLWGECDAFGSPDEAEAIAARSATLRVIRIPDAGHLPWIDDPDRVIGEIERFLSSRPATARIAAQGEIVG